MSNQDGWYSPWDTGSSLCRPGQLTSYRFAIWADFHRKSFNARIPRVQITTAYSDGATFSLAGHCGHVGGNIFLSVHNIAGEAQLANGNTPIPVSDATRFAIDSERNQATNLSNIDYDGDDVKDSARYLIQQEDGEYSAITPPQPLDDATHIGIYLTGNPKTEQDTGRVLPNFVRVVDRNPHLNDQGLQTSINKVDLQHTDLYVFRESNGQLLTNHKGIELNTEDDVHSSGDIKNSRFQYSFVIRSPDYAHRNDHLRYSNGQATGWDDSENTSKGWGNAYKNYVGWASDSKLAEPFRKNNADHLRMAERLRLVAINRASGYIGSTIFTSKDPGQFNEGWSAVDQADAINSAIDYIVMSPPNLKIWAERVHEIKQGKQSSRDKTETNIIGNEDITLEDDLAVAIHTEWLDTDGRPFPAEMGDYGYTARLAKITQNPTPDKDALQQNTTHEFSIRPGRNLNVLKFNQKELTRHH